MIRVKIIVHSHLLEYNNRKSPMVRVSVVSRIKTECISTTEFISTVIGSKKKLDKARRRPIRIRIGCMAEGKDDLEKPWG